MGHSPYSLGKRDRLELFEITVRDRSKDLALAMRQHGLEAIASQIRKREDDTILSIVNEMAYAAQAYARKWVPKDTTELMADIKVAESNGVSPGRIVFVEAVDHYGSRRRKPESAPALAYFLDTPNRVLRRSRGSGQTKDWIKDAQLDFQKNYEQIIAGAIKRYF